MVSVVTLTYDNFEELQKTLTSLQNIPGIESVVINGGSCERTKNFLLNNNIHHISEKDQGIADAFNKGISHSTGEYIAILNSGDVLLEKDYYQKAANILNSDPTVAFVYANLWMGPKKFCAAKQPFHVGKGMPFPHPSLVVRKEVYSQIGSFKTTYRIAMDYDWVLRLIKAGHKGHFVDATPILMDVNGVSIRNEKLSIEESQKALVENHLYKGEEKLYFQFRKMKFQIRSFLKRL